MNISRLRKLQLSYVKLKESVDSGVSSGQFYRYSLNKRFHLIKRLRKLWKRIQSLQKELALAGLLAGAVTTGAFGQAKTVEHDGTLPIYPQEIRNGIISFPDFVDIDNDGDLDLILGGYSQYSEGLFAAQPIKFYENIGDANTPEFNRETPVWDPFTVVVDSNTAPVLVDIDGDNDLDLFMFGLYGTSNFYRNTGTVESAVFEMDSVGNPLKDHVFPYFSLAHGDLDGDGDVDFLMGPLDSINVLRNVGTANEANFQIDTGASITGITPYRFYAMDLVDFDSDDDLDLVVAIEDSGTMLIENKGDKFVPDFDTDSPVILFGPQVNQDSQVQVLVKDLDGDGDYDIIAPDGYGYLGSQLRYYPNAGSSTNPVFEGESNNSPFGMGYTFYFASVGDVDGDGDSDVIFGGFGSYEYKTSLYFVQQDENGVFSKPEFMQNIGDGTNYLALPSLLDLDDDGDADLLVSLADSATFYFENQPINGEPNFVEKPLSGGIFENVMFTENVSQFAQADLDNDGDLDLVECEYGSTNITHWNVGTSSNPEFSTDTTETNPFHGLSLADSFGGLFLDLDGDGDLDFLSPGWSYNEMKVLENVGTSSDPEFAMDSTGSLSPDNHPGGYVFFGYGDIDEDGDVDMLGSGPFASDPYVFLQVNNPTLSNATFISPEEITVYPNPTTDYIQLEDVDLGANYYILDYRGVKRNQGVLGNDRIVPLTGLAAGNYSIIITSEGTSKSASFSKR